MKKSIISIIFITVLVDLVGISWDLSHRISLSGRLFEEDSRQEYHLNANYRPNLFLTIFENDSFSIDSEQILEFYSDLNKPDNIDYDLTITRYRSWLRYSGSQFEIRAGRQKINFGTAQILRPLQWFDTMDPTDPQNNTEGVEALLLRYYFLNNANLWFWIVSPDEDITSDTETNFKTDGLEFGGRIQYPFKYCEGAFSYHRREIESIDYDLENRFGFDCRWDFEIGLWIETMYSAKSGFNPTSYTHLFTVGADYTLSVGNGIYALSEHMFYENSVDDFPTLFQESSATSLMLTYPFGMLDSASAIINYDWISENYFYYLSYSRNYDYLSIYLNLYWNPDFNEYPIPAYNQDGKSIQLLFEINL
ncbi:hypothetical protein ACFLYJ_01310 [Candidatus Cloacimonadota bacterium]